MIVHRQLELWTASTDAPQTQTIWPALTHQQKQELIAAIARLIGKIVSAEATDQTEELRHER